MRKLWLLLAIGGLLIGLATWAGADTSAGNGKKDPAKGGGAPPKAKVGEACKVDTDCDQSGRPARCHEAKCATIIIRTVT